VAEYEGDFFPTDDEVFPEWWTWVERSARVLSRALTRIGVGILSAGAAIAAGLMFNSPGGAQYAGVTLALGGIFAAWFVISAVIASIQDR
jgi:hypothetical protein